MSPTSTSGLCVAERTFGVGFAQWVVCEVKETGHPHYGPVLIFMSDGIARRVRDYPANWRELSEELLYAMSWNR